MSELTPKPDEADLNTDGEMMIFAPLYPPISTIVSYYSKLYATK
jgi:hypothetical protein